MVMIENEEKITRALLVSVDTGDFDAEASLSELEELVKSAGAEPEFTLTQKLQRPESATFVGSGKLQEIKELCEAQELDLIVVDSELSPTQIKNIENFTDVRVIDRTTLILDIFAQRARSKEGKLQVELAQLKYLLPRLTGKGIEMSRLGGGIGTRGPGETKIETDRRHIRRRMETLKEELAEVEKHRHMLRRRREKDGVITCAIVGYTNAGKSTLMNTLTDAGVLAQDKLFATLDPTSRALKLPSGVSVMLIDTVGLVRTEYFLKGLDGFHEDRTLMNDVEEPAGVEVQNVEGSEECFAGLREKISAGQAVHASPFRVQRVVREGLVVEEKIGAMQADREQVLFLQEERPVFGGQRF